MCEECNDKARKKEEEEEEQEPELRSYQRDLYDWLWEKRLVLMPTVLYPGLMQTGGVEVG